MDIPFEATRSFCYRFSRYQAIPEILQLPQVISGAPFRMIDVAKIVIDRHLTPEQQSTMLKRAQSDREDSVLKTVKYYIPFIAKNTGQLIPLGGGMYRLPTADDIDEDDLADAALEDAALDDETGEAVDFDGSVYAFSFPVLVKSDAPFPIKVGMTTGDVRQRVESQCKGAATFDNPVILKSWQVKRVSAVEKAIHNVLRSRGKWRENVPGIEWFDTTVTEIESIVQFIVQAS